MSEQADNYQKAGARIEPVTRVTTTQDGQALVYNHNSLLQFTLSPFMIGSVYLFYL